MKPQQSGENAQQRIYIVMKILVYLIKENSKVKEFIFNPELNHRKKYIKTMTWLENIYKKAEHTTNDISNGMTHTIESLK